MQIKIEDIHIYLYWLNYLTVWLFIRILENLNEIDYFEEILEKLIWLNSI
jgi:hypothetical protein